MTVEKTCRLNDYRYINREGVSSMKRVYSNKTQGFTLVELLVVMLVLVALSSITLDFTKDFAFQGRYEVTKDRYDKIKRAIIGRPDVLINGQPDISGFVADMGRLPRNIQELLVQNYCMPNYTISQNNPGTGIIPSVHATHKAWCEASPNTAGDWEEQSDDANCTGSDTTLKTQALCEAASEVWSGWKGPYFTTQKPDYKANAFSDGWGNEASSVTDHNYGWTFCLGSMAVGGCYTSSPVIGVNELLILSKGKNQVTGGSVNTYDEDFPVNPIAINANQWQVSINNNITINITPPNNGYCNDSVCSNPSYDISSCSTAKNATWIVGNCTDVGGTFIGHTQAGCTGLIWTDVSIATGICSDIAYTTQATCVGATKIWTVGVCSNQSYPTLSECIAPVGSELTASCDDGASGDKATCEAVPAKWSSSASEFNCQKGGGNWVVPFQMVNIVLARSDGTFPVTIPAAIDENGLNQNVAFNAATNMPQGLATLNVFKAGTTDIYPASCSGLNSDTNTTDAFSSDCLKIGGTLLNNGLCDDVSINECTTGTDGTGGLLLRNALNITILPFNIITNVSW